MRLSSGLLGFRSRQLLSGCGNPRCAADSASPAQLPLGWTGPVSSAPSVVRSYYNCPATAGVGRAWLLASAEPTSIFCSQPLQLLTYLGVRETFTSLEVFTQRHPQDSASRVSWTSSARLQPCSYSRARALAASPHSRVANSRPRFQHSAPPRHSTAFLSCPSQLDPSRHSTAFLSCPSRLTSGR